MELREFAQQVLFATNLDEKLRAPVEITDERPGSALLSPQAPGRPLGLRFKPQGTGKNEFPGTSQLENQEARGKLLHFFANHELLATELMALALLKFPDAPSGFRAGLLKTLKDEQQHTRWYIERMRTCGIQFGELPVSAFFWRAISGMESPMDYVAGLSLTFEQANLDFARQYARGFEAAGDAETAALLENIYRDEIGHVAYGLKWLRRWKNPDESDWAAFCRHLKFPLSPQRAKGPKFNAEGRRAAGFHPEFIDELEVYSQSRGRTPNVFAFNPFAEGYIALGKAFTPVKHQALLARDLDNLPQFLCRQDDVVLVSRRPSVHFQNNLKQAGFALPEFTELKDGRIPPKSNLATRKIGSLRPWAWGPDILHLFQPLFGHVTGEHRTISQYYNESTGRLYSKSWSAEFLQKILAAKGAEDWLCTKQEVGEAVSGLAAAKDVISKIRSKGHHKIVLKESLGLAGHNSIRLWEHDLLDSQQRWIERATSKGGTLIVEPWLEREADFSVQFEMTAKGLKILGYTGLTNDAKGQYLANWAAPDFKRRPPLSFGKYFGEYRNISRCIQSLYDELRSELESDLTKAGYQGPLGIDAFVYRKATGRFALKPLVEMNPRYTMGRVTLELMNRVAPGGHGVFRLINVATLRKKGFQDFSSYAKHLRERFPVHVGGEPLTKLAGGAICLNDPETANVCLATFQVSRSQIPWNDNE